MPRAQLHFERSGGNIGETPRPWQPEMRAPEWVRLLLTESDNYQEVRLTYQDGSYTVWRMRIY